VLVFRQDLREGIERRSTYFVLKGEDVGDALRAIWVDATTSKGQGKDVSNGGYFSTLASIKSMLMLWGGGRMSWVEFEAKRRIFDQK